MEKVRESMKDVLERERMLMRGRLADSLSSRTRQQDDPDRNSTYIENKKNSLEEEIMSDTEDNNGINEFEENDSIWGRRQNVVRRNPNINYG